MFWEFFDRLQKHIFKKTLVLLILQNVGPLNLYSFCVKHMFFFLTGNNAH